MAMDPISGGIEAGAGLISSIIGQIVAAGNQDEARVAMQRASEAYNIPLPVLQNMVAQQLGPSAMQGVQADPSLIGDQNNALGQLQNIADSGGQTLEDTVNNNKLQQDAAQRAMQQRQSIVNTIARGGQAPGAISAATQLGAVQGQQEAGANAAAQTAANSKRRAMQAVLQKGQLAGQMRGQGFSEASQRAQAADQIAKYNAAAQARAQTYNLGIPEQNYKNQMSRAQGQAGVQQDWAGYLGGEAQRQRSTAADFGAGIGKAGAGIYQATRPQPSTSVDPSVGQGYDYQYAPQKLDEEDYG